MKKITRPMGIFAGGTMGALLLVAAALLFMNPPQCPADYTPHQVNASGCIIGANIGTGLVFTLAIGIWITAIVLAIAAKKQQNT